MAQSTFFPDCFYRVSIKGIYVKDGKVLLCGENKEIFGGKWALPGGGLDFGEEMKAGLVREIKEETGLNVTKISEKPVYIWTHRYESNIRQIGWYYSIVLAFRIDLEDLNLRPTAECEAIDFYSKEDMLKMSDEHMLEGQGREFAELFNPDDFKENF